ncbi:MAG: cytochrome c [Salinimicrobium sp.]
MKITFKLLLLLMLPLAIACGNDKKEEKEQIKLSEPPTEQTKKEPATATSETIDMDNKGVGPVKEVNLDENIDQAMATHGQELFQQNCTACHKTDKKFIGPAIAGVTERRSPEWIMNMILNPDVMIQEDPIAKQLLIAHNGSPMANQGLDREQARAILEYFRTLKE